MNGLLIDGAMIFAIGMMLGAAVGASLAWHRFCRTESPSVELRITPEVGQQIVDKVMREWLERRELTVMPRGREFH